MYLTAAVLCTRPIHDMYTTVYDTVMHSHILCFLNWCSPEESADHKWNTAEFRDTSDENTLFCCKKLKRMQRIPGWRVSYKCNSAPSFNGRYRGNTRDNVESDIQKAPGRYLHQVSCRIAWHMQNYFLRKVANVPVCGEEKSPGWVQCNVPIPHICSAWEVHFFIFKLNDKATQRKINPL